MNRDCKEFAAGTITHIYNRGNHKENIFLDDQDYKAFLYRIALVVGFDQKELVGNELLSFPHSRIRIEFIGKNNFKIHSFCLMPNHFHLLIEQCADVSISKMISKLSASYSKYINNKYDRVGHVFQDCFKAVNIESNSQLMWTSAYIHMNPVKNNLVNRPEQYKWSSYNDFASDRNLPIVSTDLIKSVFGDNKNLIEQTLQLISDEHYVKETL